MENMRTIGIDFGNTKTLVARMAKRSAEAETVRLGNGTDHIPTSIYIDALGHFFFGADADDRMADPCGVYLTGFKMCLGNNSPFHIQMNEDGSVVPYMAVDLVTQFLRYIRLRVQESVFDNHEVTSAVITRPVKFSPIACEQLKQAALQAGFSQVELTTEPEAAGIAFCRQYDSDVFDKSAVIVDWGGGTLDFALVTRSGVHVHTDADFADGDLTIGGSYFDAEIWKYAEQCLQEQGITGLSPIGMMHLIRRTKEKLSSSESASLYLSTPGGVSCPPVALTRETFIAKIKPAVARAADMLSALLERIPAAEKPEKILLVGGSCRIPYIQQRLEEQCGLPVVSWHLAREAVALGAALWFSPVPVAVTPEYVEPEAPASPEPSVPEDEAPRQQAEVLEPVAQVASLKKRPLWPFVAVAGCSAALLAWGGVALLAPQETTPAMPHPEPKPLPVAEPTPMQQAQQELKQRGILPLSYAELLRKALIAADEPLLQLLQTAGADVNALNAQGRSLLHEMIADGNVDALQRLLKLPGVDVNVRAQDGITPLMQAAENRPECIPYLLACPGIEVNLVDAAGNTALHYAFRRQDATAIQALISAPGLDFFALNHAGNPALFVGSIPNRGNLLAPACRQQALAELQQLGISPDAYTEHLFAAVQQQNARLLYSLIFANANVNVTDAAGNTPLHYAAQLGPWQNVVMLLVGGASVNTADSQGRTPLYYAAQRGDINTVRELCGQKADIVDKVGCNEISPLYAAIVNGHGACVEHMLNPQGDSDGSMEVVDRSILSSTLIEDMNLSTLMLLILLDEGWLGLPADDSYNQVDAYFGRTALCWAVIWNCADDVETLLTLNDETSQALLIDVNKMDKLGKTPLDYATGRCAEVLLQHGAKHAAELAK